jgi:hypothetical protein
MMKPGILLRGLGLLLAAALCASAQETGEGRPAAPGGIQESVPNVYLDCDSRLCDFDFIKTEITFVNYIRDRQNADVHLLITRRGTGSGGGEITLSFIGRGRHEGRNHTLHCFTRPTDTSDIVRRSMVNSIKQGLVPYLYDTPLAECIDVVFTQRDAIRPTPGQDPWDYWVFNVGLRGSGDYEKLSEKYSYQVNLSANRITEELKLQASASAYFSRGRYEISEEETYISHSTRKSLSLSAIKSLGDHWAAGVSGGLSSSTFENQELFVSVGPALEYNIFPYSQSTRREMRIQYRIGVNWRDYYEMTLFEKTKETLLNQSLSVAVEMRERWGSMWGSIRGSNFLHDFSKNNFRVSGGLWVNLIKGLSFNVSGEYSRVRDQLSLPFEGASKEEILLELKRLATTYNLRFEMGLNYRFGSLYSNVVNPRFGD